MIPQSRHILSCMLSVLFFLPVHQVFSQTPKGVIITDKQTAPAGKTRALVVGISEYEFITPLNYAHRDAELFAEYLRDSRFWDIEQADITLLTNDKARNGDIITQLARLAQILQKGDRLIFYFSGHGDVETITQFKNGYLLAHDTYSNNYIAGALPVSFLRELFLTIATKDIQVIIITDACKSGKLAGGLKGAEAFATAMGILWKNEIKILSTEPGLLSYEDVKWGNGRGVFSYYLVKGLKGEADTNKDSAITLVELENYVGKNVAAETANEQQPKFEGPGKYSLVITRLQKNNQPVVPGKPAGNNFKSLIKKIPANLDSCDYYYGEMEKAIREERLISPAALSATSFYRKLRSCTKDTAFMLEANSRLLAALMNRAQEIVNNTFIGKNFVKENEYGYASDLYDQVIENNDLRLPYRDQLTNLKRYLKVLHATLWDWRSDMTQIALELDSAMKQEPGAAYLLSARGVIELRRNNYTHAIHFLEKATALSPGWLMPKYYLGIAYGYKKDYRKALDFYNEVLQKDPQFRTFECAKCILEQMAEYEKKLKRVRYDKFSGDTGNKNLLDSVRHSLADNIDSAAFYHDLGERYDKKNHPFQDSVYIFYSKAVELDPWESRYMYTLLRYLRKKSYGEAEIREWLRKTGEYEDDDKNWFLEEMLFSYLYSKEPANAFKVAIELYENGYYSCSKLKKMSGKFGKLPEYLAFIKENCTD
jgi:protein O-mannosyl-transferase